jgi:hypothetical protein
LLDSDHHYVSEELLKFKFHKDPVIRELIISLDIMMTSVRFSKLSHSASFMMPFYMLNNQTKISSSRRNGFLLNLEDFIKDFKATDNDLQEAMADFLNDAIEELLFDILEYSSEEYCVFLLEKLLDPAITKQNFFEILDASPIKDGAKLQLAHFFEMAKGEFENYDIKQILGLICSEKSLKNSADDIDKIEPAQRIESIKLYVQALLAKVKTELTGTADKLLLNDIKKYQTKNTNNSWRNKLKSASHNIPTWSETEQTQHTILIFRDITNTYNQNLTTNLSDAHLLRINFSLKQPPNYRTILEEAESRDQEAYKLIVIAAAKQIILAQSKGLENVIAETKEAIPDLIYRLMKVAKTPQEKKLISDLTHGVLSAERLESDSNKSLAIFFTDYGKYDWIQSTFSWPRLEPLIQKVETLDNYLEHRRTLNSRIFSEFYSPEKIRKCKLMKISPYNLCEFYLREPEKYRILTSENLDDIYKSGATFDSLFKLHNENEDKFRLLTSNEWALKGYRNNYWSFNELNSLNLAELKRLLNPEVIVCIKARFSAKDIADSFGKNDPDLYSENMQSLLKIGATKNIVELLNQYKPWMLKSLLNQSKKAEVEGKSFSDIYFHQGQGFMNQRTNPLPVVAGTGALLYRPDSPGINFARLVNRAVSRIDLHERKASLSPKPRRVRSTPDLQRTDQTEPQAHTI